MAATNFTPIQLYHSTTAAAVPVSTNLTNGELAINITDGKLYYKDNGGTVQVIATKATGTIGGSTTQVQYNNTGALAGSANFTFDGTTATINTLNLTNALGAAYGGTAQSTYAQGDLLYASAANTLAKLPIGISTYILTSNGTIPGWAAPSSISVNTATNLAGGAAGSVPYQSGPGATTFLLIGTANQVITSSGSAPQWSSGLSITTLTASDAVTFSATTQNIALGTSQTSGTFTVGGAAQTGTQTIDQSTKTHTLNIGAGATESGATKTVNLATAGVSGSTTTMSVGSAVSGAITNLTVNATTTLAPIARSTGAVSYFTVTTPADTGLTASTEVIGSSFSAATRTWATGALTLQRERVFAAPTYAFAGASTLTTAVNVDIGLPVAGTNATITNAYALRAADSLFTGPTIVDVNSASAALRITQVGAGNALLVEDSTNPDATPFVVTAAGDVGIGTSSPAYKLDVSGTAQIGGASPILYVNDGTINYRVIPTAGAAYVGTISNHPVIFQTNNGSQATLDTSGNLGLGVTPSAKLEIYSTNNAFNALQVRYNGSNDAMGFGIGNSNGFPYLGYNTKSQASVDAPVYERSNPAAQLRMDNGSFKFNIAPSGTANTTTITNGVSYTIITSGNQTDFGAANNNVGTSFTATSSGTLSSGTVSQNISFTQAMTLDASGYLLVGTTTSPSQQAVIYRTSATTSNGALLLDGNGNYAGLQFASSGTLYGSLAVDSSALYLTHNSVLAFKTGASTNVGGTERARITSGGYFKASNDGVYAGSGAAYHELRTTGVSWTLYAQAANATAANCYGISLEYSAAAPNGTGNEFIKCYDNAATRAAIRSNGGLANYQSNNVDLSDIRTKTDISPLASYWNKIAALEIVTYKYKDQTHDDLNIGVIAQQVEQVAPEFVDADGFGETPEDGVPLKTIYNKDLTFAAIKALQEAMARIEQLEAKVAALEAK